MSLQYRKKVRDQLVALYSDSSTGFNATLNVTAADYGIAPFEIDFSGAAQSHSFTQCYIEPDMIEDAGQILEFPAMTIYTTDGEDDGLPRGVRYHGRVVGCVDVFYRVRLGIEPPDTESILDAIEDSLLLIINNPAIQWTPGVLFARETKLQRTALMQLGDGFQQMVRLQTIFTVVIP